MEIFNAYILFSLLFWIFFYGSLSVLFFKIFIIDLLTPDYNDFKFPELSIIITACNEADTIEPALRSLMLQNYPSFEVIAVNDRSTDGTPVILDRLADEFSNLRIIHIDHLPENWLGKVHALHSAVGHASGEWILFTDADVHFSKDVLQKCLYYSTIKQLDHFTIAPKMIAETYLLEIMFRTFSFMFSFISRAMPEFLRKNMAIGVGAFNLVRKSAFEKTEGFTWLRMEVADDVGLALMLKHSGARSEFAITLEDVSVRWYHSFYEMMKGLEKNIFGVSTGYNIYKTVIHLFLITIITPAPFIALFFSGDLTLQASGIASILFLILSAIIYKFRFNETFFHSLFIPFGLVILTLISLRAGIICIRNGGINWRGTFYKISDLKKGQRVNTSI